MVVDSSSYGLMVVDSGSSHGCKCRWWQEKNHPELLPTEQGTRVSPACAAGYLNKWSCLMATTWFEVQNFDPSPDLHGSMRGTSIDKW